MAENESNSTISARQGPAPQPASGSILLLHLNDRSAVSALADLLVLVVRLDLEAKLATVDLQEFSLGRDLLAFGGRAEVLDVDLEADRRMTLGEMRLDRLDGRAF